MKSKMEQKLELYEKVMKSLAEAEEAVGEARRVLKSGRPVTPRIEEAAYWCSIQALRLVRTIKFGPSANTTERLT